MPDDASLSEPAAELASKLLHDHVVSRIWQRDMSVWDAEPGSAAAKSIASRLGWLDVATTMRPHLDRLAALGHAAREEGIREVYLLGMGGSSLCAEVLRSVYGVTPGSPELFVLDTTDERTITQAAARIDPERTLVLVASKSGGTVEVASMERFFWQRLSAAPRQQGGPAVHRRHRSRHRARAAGRRTRVSRRVHQPGRHRRTLLGAVALRTRAHGADRRAGARSARGRRGDGRRLPPGEPRQRRVRARRVHRARRRSPAATS